MFYVEKIHTKKSFIASLAQYAPAIIVFAAFFGLTVWSYLDSTSTLNNKRNRILDERISKTENDINERLSVYQNIMQASAGLANVSSDVSEAQWRSFIANFNINERYPGIQGIGYIQIVPSSQLNNHVAAMRSNGHPKYTISPLQKKDLYASIVYLEPQNENNQSLIGFDMYSKDNRRVAMDAARDTNQATLTDVVDLLVEPKVDKQPGLVMFLPLYKVNSNSTTIQDRQSNITGYVFAPFKTFDLISQSTDVADDSYGFKLIEKNTNKSTIYTSPSYNDILDTQKAQTISRDFKVFNKDWRIEGIIAPNIIPSSDRRRPTVELWTGIFFSVIVAVFIYLLMLNRSRILANQEAEEVQEAKDELLALASHQLRTPATGVKQYIGMIREGYAGKITTEQKKFLDKAYASNERQLSTINEMLTVARADAGDIKLTKSKTNISSLLKDILEEQSSSITTMHHTIKKKIPRKAIYANIDAHYIRMAIDNIISNSIKYTPQGGNIVIELISLKSIIKIAITDNGVGVNSDNFEMLFKKFSRIPNELTSQVSGSGIGLYLAKQVVLAHRGKINFSSEENVGSTCTISLPIGNIA